MKNRTNTPPWIIVAKREIMVQLTDKAFWIGTLTTLGLVALGFIFAGFMGGGSDEPSKVAVASDEAAQVLVLASEDGTPVEALRVDEGELASAVEDGDAVAALTRAGDGWEMTVKDYMDAPNLAPAVESYQMGVNAAEYGVDVADLRAGTTMNLVALESEEGRAGAVIIATIAFALLFMMSAITYGMQLANSVVTEKESRIVEILAAAIPTKQLLIGKIVGNTILAISQVILIAAVALVALSLSDWSHFLGLIAPVAGWFVLFFLVGFASLACLWAGAGAMATRMQDLGQTTTPLMMIVMLVYFAGFFASGETGRILSYVPIASTVSMPGRLLSGEATWIDALIALAVALVFMAFAVWLGSKIYRRGLLRTGSVLSWKDALRKTV